MLKYLRQNRLAFRSMFYFSTNYDKSSTVSLSKEKFYQQHNHIMEKIKDNQKFFIGFTEPKDKNEESSEIRTLKLKSPEEVKSFINFFTENSETFKNIIYKKLQQNNQELNKDKIYEAYITNKKDNVAGVYPIVIDNDKIGGFGALVYYDKMPGRLNLSMYLFDDYQGKKIGSQMELFLCLRALENQRKIQGATDRGNVAADVWGKVCKKLEQLGYKKQITTIHKDFRTTIVEPEQTLTSSEYVNNMFLGLNDINSKKEAKNSLDH
ncbi:MAG: hypothetical protein RL208_452 [Pseudomonadota bacterium]